MGLYAFHAIGIGYVVDDAYISFRYAQNLANGEGLVYNIGQRVEGYTNFLWVVLIAGLSKCKSGIDPLVAAQVVSLLCGGATMVLLVRTSKALHPNKPWCSLIAPLLLAANTTYCAWSTSGLETTAFSFLTTLAVLLCANEFRHSRGTWLAVLAVICVALLRADGFVVFAILTVVRAVEHRRRKESIFNRYMVGWLACFVLVVGAHFAWRWSYYGYIFPNTFYAKVGSGTEQFIRGFRYVKSYLEGYGGALIVPLVLVPLIRPSAEVAIRFASLFMLGWLAYVVAVGGDGLAFHRFLVPILPLICLLVQEGIVEILRWGEAAANWVPPWRLQAGAFALAVGIAVLSASQTQRIWRHNDPEILPYRIYDNYFVGRCAAAGTWLSENTADDSIVASTPAGAIAYYSNRTVIDMLGLTDEHIAHMDVGTLGTGRAGHEKGDGAYVLAREPGYILLGNIAVGPQPMTEADIERTLCQKSEHELWKLAAFHERYELTAVKIADSGLFQYFSFYKRKP